MPIDPRSIWIVMKAGKPVRCAYGMTAADALKLIPGDRAVRTHWRRVPAMLRNRILLATATITPATIECCGCRWQLDDEGAPHPKGPDRERLAPEGVVFDVVPYHAAYLGGTS